MYKIQFVYYVKKLRSASVVRITAPRHMMSIKVAKYKARGGYLRKQLRNKIRRYSLRR